MHDSYWTHAATVESMSETIRNTFITLHEQDLIGELREQFLQQYGENGIPVSNAKLIDAAMEKRSKRRQAQENGKLPYGPPVFGESVKFGDMYSREVDETEAEIAAAEAVDEAEAESDDESDAEPEAELDSLLNSTELVDLSAYKGGDEVVVNGVKFIKLRALLPPAPPRGQFDVKRIRDSAYFFS